MFHTSVQAPGTKKDYEKQIPPDPANPRPHPIFKEALSLFIITVFLGCLSVSIVSFFEYHTPLPKVPEQFIPVPYETTTIYITANRTDVQSWYQSIEKIAKSKPKIEASLLNTLIRKSEEPGAVPFYFVLRTSPKMEGRPPFYLNFDKEKSVSYYNELLIQQGIETISELPKEIIGKGPFLLRAFKGSQELDADEPLAGVTHFGAFSLNNNILTDEEVPLLGAKLYNMLRVSRKSVAK